VSPPAFLYHYTCAEHGAPGIEADGYLRARTHPLMPQLGDVVWLTDLDLSSAPYPDKLGLTHDRIDCDRSAIRYIVIPADVPRLTWWPFIRHVVSGSVVRDLERSAWPQRWWLGRGNITLRTFA
jgi:hypothetical protein